MASTKRGKRQRHRRPRPGAPPGTLVVDPSAPPARITVIRYGPEDIDEQEVDAAAALPELLGKSPVVWINIDGLGDETVLRQVGDLFDLHGLVLEDITNVPQRAKVEQYDQALFVVTHMVSLGEGLQTEQLSIVLKRGVVLTFQERPGDCLDPVRERIRKGIGKVRGGTTDYLVYAILDAVTDHCFPVLEEYGERLETLENEVVTGAQADAVWKVRETKRDLLTLRRVLWPQRDVFNWLMREDCPFIEAETRPYLRDCYDHATRIIDAVETHREMASDLLAAHLAAVSNQMNAVMKVLAIIATIFIPITFIAGVYGMNFEKMPELKWSGGYPCVLAVMALVTMCMIVYFWRKGWLGSGPGVRS